VILSHDHSILAHIPVNSVPKHNECVPKYIALMFINIKYSQQNKQIQFKIVWSAIKQLPPLQSVHTFEKLLTSKNLFMKISLPFPLPYVSKFKKKINENKK
jgi:hypothetical protein